LLVSWTRDQPAAVVTWHDGTLWEVAVEELVIHSDVLVTHSRLAILNLNHTVNQQEGVPAQHQ
jgi:hypothetical protein